MNPTRKSRPWQTLRVREWEPARFWVQSQSRKLDHLVDINPLACSCEWSNEFKTPGENKTWCAHIKRIRLWLHDHPIKPKGGKEAIEHLTNGRTIEIPATRIEAFLQWARRHHPQISRNLHIETQGEKCLISH